MNAYEYMKRTMQSEYKARSPQLKARLVTWRRGPPLLKIDRPTNIARAHELGYKAKQGVILVRVRVGRGLSKRRKPRRGRKPSKYGRFYAYRKSLQSICEERAARRFLNCEVLNSYFVGEDGNNKFYEVILLDRAHPAIASDPQYTNLLGQRGRAFRGMTSSGRKHRGIIRKGFGTNKNRPSVRSGQSRNT